MMYLKAQALEPFQSLSNWLHAMVQAHPTSGHVVRPVADRFLPNIRACTESGLAM